MAEILAELVDQATSALAARAEPGLLGHRFAMPV
jgi:hypothetical protein